MDLPRGIPVVTVCGAGKTSVAAMEQLRGRGYDASSLSGGMKAWSLAWNSAVVPVPESAATVIQVRRTGKGCLSYLLGDAGEAAVIDPSLPPEVYQRLAGEQGWVISHVLDTHVHADHLSRSRALAAATGATLHLPQQQRAAFAYDPILDGDVLRVGASQIVALRTPGHTMESTCYLLDGRALFSGDTLFLAGVGRPDLEASAGETPPPGGGRPGRGKRERAGLLHGSLRRLLTLPAETLVLPGHTSVPAPFNGEPIVATLHEVAAQVEHVHLPRERFVETILSRIPPTPPNHAQIVALNEAGIFPAGDPD